MEEEILKKHCYTELVYQRINKKLGKNDKKLENESFIKKVIGGSYASQFLRKGKNFYISNKENNIRITVNSNTFRIITVDKFIK